MALHTLLAIEPKQILTIALIACGVILLIAFFIGCKKGFCKIGWGGLTWTVAAIAAIVVCKKLSGANNPLTKIGALSGKAVLSDALLAIAAIAASVLAALLLNAIASLIFRPRKKKEEDDIEDIYFSEKGVNIIDRLVGGIVCVLNTALILAGILLIALVVANITPLKNTLSAVYENGVVAKVMDQAKIYAMDVLSVGVVILIARAGYRSGALGSLRTLLITFGGLLITVLGFGLPFLAPDAAVISTVVQKCTGLIEAPVSKVSAALVPIAGKLISGVVLVVILMIVYMLLNFILKIFSRAVKSSKPFRVVDGTLACLLYLVIGAAVVTVFWALLYALEYCGLYGFSGLFTTESPFVNSVYELCAEYIAPHLEKIKAKLPA